MGDIPQSNYQNNQNFTVNIQKMYKHYITGSTTPNDNDVGEVIGIDDMRGELSVSVTGQSTANLIKSLNIDSSSTVPTSTPNTGTPLQLAQESRCHAFYRIVGFPVVAIDHRFYNPGLDVIKIQGVKRNITLADKIQIAENVGKDFEAISQSREAFAAGTAAIFSVPESVEAGVLALTSGTYGQNGNPNIRKFNAPFVVNTQMDPFDFKIADQAYASPGDIASTYSLAGGKPRRLSEYQDGNGTPPNANIGGYKVLKQHEHIIVPFMVDPRIDFSIWGNKTKTISNLSKRVAVPFVPDASYLMVGSTSFADTPLLEKIITKRFSQVSSDKDGGLQNAAVTDFTKSLKTIEKSSIGTASISDIFSDNVFKFTQQDAFDQYFTKIKSMIAALSAAMHVIHFVQGNYYWLPIPATSGPEGGCNPRDVPINKSFDLSLLSDPADSDIIANQLNFWMSNINANSAKSNAIPDLAGSTRPVPVFSFDSDTSDSEGDVTSETRDTIITIRNKLLKDAAQALQTVEMIMGEFSGLGLCDIIAVVGALHVVPKEVLLGFLDDDAYDRAKQTLGVALPVRSNIAVAMSTLAETVSFFYQIMDLEFKSTFGNNASNT